jgi:hypothetical protein
MIFYRNMVDELMNDQNYCSDCSLRARIVAAAERGNRDCHSLKSPARFGNDHVGAGRALARSLMRGSQPETQHNKRE